MTETEITKATILVATLHNVQKQLDNLEVKAEFKYNLKHTCNKFTNELDKFIENMYKHLNEDDNLKYNEISNLVDYAIEAIESGNVRIEE